MSSRLFCVVLSSLLCISTTSYAGEWVVHASDLKEKHSAIVQSEKQIEDLIAQKNQTKDATQVKSILEQIITAHEELEKQVSEFNELRSHIRFDHPAQGDDAERLYRIKKVKPLDAYEGGLGIRGKLEIMKRSMMTTYGVEEKKKTPKVEPEEEKGLDTETPRIKLSY